MDVAKGLISPPHAPTASFDGGAAAALKPASKSQPAVFAVDVPDGTQKIAIAIAAGGDFWDYSQDLTLAAGPPATISLVSPVNPGSFVAPFANPNTTDGSVELWVVLTQIRDATSEVIAAASNSALGDDPCFARLGP